MKIFWNRNFPTESNLSSPSSFHMNFDTHSLLQLKQLGPLPLPKKSLLQSQLVRILLNLIRIYGNLLRLFKTGLEHIETLLKWRLCLDLLKHLKTQFRLFKTYENLEFSSLTQYFFLRSGSCWSKPFTTKTATYSLMSFTNLPTLVFQAGCSKNQFGGHERLWKL